MQNRFDEGPIPGHVRMEFVTHTQIATFKDKKDVIGLLLETKTIFDDETPKRFQCGLTVEQASYIATALQDAIAELQQNSV